MKTVRMSIGEAKKRFSEAVNQTCFSENRIIITKRSRPVAAIVKISDLQAIERAERGRGLASVLGTWDRFEEIEPSIHEAVKARRREGPRRRVSL